MHGHEQDSRRHPVVVIALIQPIQKTIDFLGEEYAAVRAGRANPHVLDKIKVDYYGTPTPIQQVGNVSVPEARIIQIAPWEKTLLKDIEKAILASDVGITPTNDGSVIRLVFPELTEENSILNAVCGKFNGTAVTV